MNIVQLSYLTVSVSYIGSHLLYKPKNDLCVHKTELESTFIELIETKKPNVIIGAVYRHLNKGVDGFNDRYLNPSQKWAQKQTDQFLCVVTYNGDLLKHDYHAPTNEFLDSLTSMFLPQILQPAGVSSSFKTL